MKCRKCGNDKVSMWTGLCDDCTAFESQFENIWTELRTEYPELLFTDEEEA